MCPVADIALQMWLLKNRTPFAVERSWTRDADGIHWWLVAIRATYDVDARGALSLAQEQLPVPIAPEFHGEPGESSVLLDSDLLGIKPGTDIVVDGYAHAPGGKPAPKVSVGLRIGERLKELVVFGDRVYYEGVTGRDTTAPQPFVRAPIRYELAEGGANLNQADVARRHIDERNPIGRGFGGGKGWANAPAHSIEFADGRKSSAGPAGFGPIDRGWLPRRTLAGTYDKAWVDKKKPLLPDDYDPKFAMSAPEDQQVLPWLEGGETIGLINLSPAGTLAVSVPKVELHCTTRFGTRREQHGAKLTTVFIEPDQERVSVVWQSSLRVRAPDLEYLDETEIERR